MEADLCVCPYIQGSQAECLLRLVVDYIETSRCRTLSGQLAPDVKEDYTSDVDEANNKDGYRSDLKSRCVVGVEAKDATTGHASVLHEPLSSGRRLCSPNCALVCSLWSGSLGHGAGRVASALVHVLRVRGHVSLCPATQVDVSSSIMFG